MTLLSRLLKRGSTKLLFGAGATANTGLEPAKAVSLHPRDLQYCRRLHIEQQETVPESDLKAAWKQLEAEMSLVPEGEVVLAPSHPESLDYLGVGEVVWVSSIHVDRYCVTNAQFAAFVADSGYANEALWPSEILPQVLRFVDKTGCSGPRFWRDGRPEGNLLDHPVVGISWYEANAFAHWCGKRLLSPAEWQHAATWASTQRGNPTRYPWGDSFDPSRCNTWNSGTGTTVPVREHYEGCTPNGIYQLIGNVWEWTASLFESEPSANGDQVITETPLAETRGGAFDTYFASQASAQFRTGQTLLHRGGNVGFRCCIPTDQIVDIADPYAFLEDDEANE